MRADKCAQHYNQCIYKIHVHDSLQSIKHNQCKITNERYHDKAKKLQEPKDTKTLVMPIKVLKFNVVCNTSEELQKWSGTVCRQQRCKPLSNLNVLVLTADCSLIASVEPSSQLFCVVPFSLNMFNEFVNVRMMASN